MTKSRPQRHFPLSREQRDIWLLDQLAAGSTVNNIAFRAWVEGPLDDERLRAATNRLGELHPVLTARVVRTGDGPVQELVAGPSFTSVRSGSRGDVLARSTQAVRTPFELGDEPPARVRVDRSEFGEACLLTLVAHHIVCDGTSLHTALTDLGGSYSRPTADLQPTDATSEDFFVALDRLARRSDDSSWWTDALRGRSGLGIPADRHARARPVSTEASSLPFHLHADVTAQVRATARSCRATPFLVVMASFQVALSLLSGQRDVTVGAPVHGRDRTTRHTVGMFARTLPFRLQVDDAECFRQTVARLKVIAREAYAHADDPLGTPDGEPAFEAALVFQNFPVPLDVFDGLELRPEPVPPVGTRHRLELEVWDGPTLAGQLLFPHDTIDEGSARQVLNVWHQVLTLVLASPEFPLRELPVAPARDELGSAWRSGPAPDAAHGETVPDAFRRRARERPEAPALVTATGTTTYAQLDLASDQLAHRLRTVGTRRGDLVGLVAAPGPDLVVGQLAVMKAGAAYVPLDPGAPQARWSLIVEDAGLSVVVSPPEHVDRTAALGVEVVVPDDHRSDGPPPAPSAWPDGVAAADDLAYVMYTSGTTGVPKGVQVQHRNIMRLVLPSPVGPLVAATVLAHSSPAFDASTFEIWGPLCHGGTVAFAPSGPLGTRELADWCAELGVTHLWLTAGMFSQVARSDLSRFQSLRVIVAGGDVLPPQDCALVLDALPTVALYNGYGPTESCTFASTHHVRREDVEAARIPIGRPLAGTSLGVLDEHGRPLPAGCVGELWISGQGLARGYLGDPDLTSDRFRELDGVRCYRTGDLARWRHDGTLDFLGRSDLQVKIRGFRVEPAEVDKVLATHPDVLQVATVAVQVTHADKQLVSYVVRSTGVPSDADLADSLLAHVASRLPRHLVPSSVSVVEHLPLTLQGKLDVAALPAPTRRRAPASWSPRGDREVAVCQAMSEVLGTAVGVSDDFFLSGGDSLLATRLLSLLEDEWETDLRLRDVFETPTATALATRLTDRRRADRQPAHRLARPARVPLTFAQERLWFVDQLEGTGAAYHMAVRAHLDDGLDLGTLGAALLDIVERHEVLRTRLVSDDGRPHQVVDPAPRESPLSVHVADGEDVPTVLARLEEQAFVLATDMPLRATVVTATGGVRVLSLVLHHVAADAWSVGIITRDLAHACLSRANGEAPVWTPLPLQYADVAVRQRAETAAARERRASGLDFWARTLAGLPAQTDLDAALRAPTDITLAAALEVAGADGDPLPERLSRALGATAHARRMSVFAVVRSAVAIVLSKLGETSDIAIGVPVAGRDDHDLRDLVGFFSNTVVMRSHLDEDSSLGVVLDREREMQMSAHEHDDVPFEHVVEHLNPPRVPGRTPLFQVLVSLEDGTARGTAVPGVCHEVEAVELSGMKFPLMVTLVHDRDASRYSLRVRASGEAIGGERARVLAARLIGVLDALTGDCDRRLSELDVLLPGERELLCEWGGATTSHMDACLPTVPELFVGQAARTPARVAVRTASEQITYAALADRVARLSEVLEEHGVGRGERVAIACRPGVGMVVAVLAALCSGAAYVPVDPRYPRPRVQHMLATARPKVVLVDSDSKGPVDGLGPVLLDIGSLVATAGAMPHTPRVRAVPTDAAYVMFTSGSTGLPKAVVIAHRSLSWYVGSATVAYKGLPDSALLHAPFSFDTTVTSLHGPLVCGGTVVVGSIGVAAGGPQGGAASGPTGILKVTPSHLPLLLDSAHPAPVHELLVAGELLDSSAVDVWRRQHPETVVANVYGPTETTVSCAQLVIAPGVALDDGPVPVGVPLPGARLYVVGRHGDLVPPGTPGEILIGGPGVAEGYFGDGEATAASFVRIELGGRLERVYRSGDLGRWDSSGRLVVLGRLDAQLKVHGVRVEPAEVDATLAEHPRVTRSVTLGRPDPRSGATQLVSYVATRDAGVSEQALRTFVAGRLPRHLVPARIELLPSLPLTSNGKVDVAALADVGSPATNHTGLGRAPEGVIELAVAQAWSSVLGRTGIRAKDDFFSLGGHSLAAMRVAALLSRVLERDVRIETVLAAPVLEDLAAALGDLTSAAPPGPTDLGSPPVALEPRQVEPSRSQLQMWMLAELDPAANTAYTLGGAVTLLGPLDVGALRDAIDAVVARHEALRTTITQDHTGDVVGTVWPHRPFELPVETLSPDDGARRQQVRARLEQPFDLGRAPLVRAHLFRAAPDEHVLALALHHVAVDGWSLQLVVTAIGDTYRALSTGRQTVLPPASTTYSPEPGHVDVLRADLAYWREQLAGVRPLELPVDVQRPPYPSYRGATVRRRVPKKTEARIRALAARLRTTPFVITLAATQVVLASWCGQHDFALGTPTAGRGATSQEAVGSFANSVALRTVLPPGGSFADVVAAARRTTLDAIAHQHAGFDEVVAAVNPDRDTGRTPIYQVLFGWQDTEPLALDLGAGLVVNRFEVERTTAVLDLSIVFKPGEQGDVDLVVEYSSDCFTRPSVERISDRLLSALEELTQQPDAPAVRGTTGVEPTR